MATCSPSCGSTPYGRRRNRRTRPGTLDAIAPPPPELRALLEAFGDELAFVFRHYPLPDVHPRALIAAEAAEAAAEQGAFWEMHDLLFASQSALEAADLRGYATALGLEVERFAGDLRERRHARRVAEDAAGAERSGVAGTPTFFVNGRRHRGAYDLASLAAAVRAARDARRRQGTSPQP